jgi:hypothetical protein
VADRFHVRRAGVVVVTQSDSVLTRDADGQWQFLQIAPGDTVYPYEYIGEGWHYAVVDGHLVELEAFWEGDVWGLRAGRARGRMIQAPLITWWIKIERHDSSTAWVRTDDPTVIEGPNYYCARMIPDCGVAAPPARNELC